MTNEMFAQPRTGPAPFTLNSSRTGDRHLSSLSGELDVATAAGLILLFFCAERRVAPSADAAGLTRL